MNYLPAQTQHTPYLGDTRIAMEAVGKSLTEQVRLGLINTPQTSRAWEVLLKVLGRLPDKANRDDKSSDSDTDSDSSANNASGASDNKDFEKNGGMSHNPIPLDLQVFPDQEELKASLSPHGGVEQEELELSPEQLLELLIELAEDPETLPEILALLAQHDSARIRLAVAHNPSTDARTLGFLSTDKNLRVRVAVAGNLTTPEDVLAIMMNNGSADVSYAARANPHLPDNRKDFVVPVINIHDIRMYEEVALSRGENLHSRHGLSLAS